MNLYMTESYQKHCVVAESMSEAVKLWNKKYGEDPTDLKLESEYVIVQGKEL